MFVIIEEAVFRSFDLAAENTLEKELVQFLVFTQFSLMACSSVALLVPTVCAVAGFTCAAFAFGSDNWYEVRVNTDGNSTLADLREFESDPRYYSRDEGIFRICFTGKRPKGGKKVK